MYVYMCVYLFFCLFVWMYACLYVCKHVRVHPVITSAMSLLSEQSNFLRRSCFAPCYYAPLPPCCYFLRRCCVTRSLCNVSSTNAASCIFPQYRQAFLIVSPADEFRQAEQKAPEPLRQRREARRRRHRVAVFSTSGWFVLIRCGRREKVAAGWSQHSLRHAGTRIWAEARCASVDTIIDAC